MNAKIKKGAGIIGLVTLVLGVLPYQRTVVPAVRFEIQNETENPQRSVLVKQEWRDWSAESTEHAASNFSDSAGEVRFPERKLWTCRLYIFAGALLQVLTQGVHASFGPVAFFTAYGNDPHVWTFVQYVPGTPLPATLRLKRWDTALFP